MKKDFFVNTDDMIDDVHDIEKHTLDIHALKELKILSKDLIMGVLNDEEKKFIRTQVQLAFEASKLIPDKEAAEYAKNVLLVDANLVSILNRNVKGNPILELILQQQAITKPIEEQDIDTQLIEKLNKDKRGKK